MSNTVTNTPAAAAAPVAQPVIAEFKGHKVVDGKVQAIPGTLWGIAKGESTLVPALQTELDTKVAEEKKIADKKIQDQKDAEAKKVADEATPTWKYVVFFPYYAVKFALSAVASLFSKICSIFGYGEEKKVEAKVETKTDAKTNAPAVTATATANGAATATASTKPAAK